MRMNQYMLTQAKQQLFERGVLPKGVEINHTILKSWQRCIKEGLNPYDERWMDENILSSSELKNRQEQNVEWIRTAYPFVRYLQGVVSSTNSVVVLTDAYGVVLVSLGEGGFLTKMQAVSLRSGASWLEQHRGTNAIGLALHTGEAINVHGADHFYIRNESLTSSSMPIYDGSGYVLGVLDIVSDGKYHHTHTLGLIKMAVSQIERKYLIKKFAKENPVILGLHPKFSSLGSPSEGVLVVNGDGQVLGFNQIASTLLGLNAFQQRNELPDVSQLFSESWFDLLSQTRKHKTMHYVHTHYAVKLCMNIDISRLDANMYSIENDVHIISAGQITPSVLSLRTQTQQAVLQTLEKYHGNISQAAKALGISRTTLYRRLRINEGDVEISVHPAASSFGAPSTLPLSEQESKLPDLKQFSAFKQSTDFQPTISDASQIEVSS